MQEFCMGEVGFRRNFPVTNRETAEILPFYVSVFGHFCCGSDYYTRRDQYEMCLLLYTIRGCGWLEYQGQQVTIPENCLAVIDCRNYQHYRTYGQEWEFYWIHFDGKCAVDLVSLLNGNGLTVAQAGPHLDFSGWVQELQRISQSADRNRELHLSELMHRLLCRAIEVADRQKEVRKYRTLQPEIDRAVCWMQEHYGEEITVEQLAKLSRMSKYHFIRVFRSLTGDTPYRYLLLYRIDRSKQLLLDTHMTVQEIADACGFSSSKNYIAAFRSCTGLTPGKFRDTMSP